MPTNIRETKTGWEDKIKQIEQQSIKDAASSYEDETVKLDPFDTSMLGVGIPNYVLDPTLKGVLHKDFPAKELPPIATPEQLKALEELEHNASFKEVVLKLQDKQNKDEQVWIQTFSGRKFNLFNPHIDSIVIQDIAHALSNICRFSGHCSSFYSVAQHSVLVSYFCNQENALYGLLHDGAEFACQDISTPLKKSNTFFAYRQMETIIQSMIYKRFDLLENEPNDVKVADQMLLATEARDLMAPIHSDWKLNVNPIPLKIIPILPQEAEKLFLNRFYELFNKR